MTTLFKYDPYCNLSEGQKEIAKAIWNSGMAERVNYRNRYKVSEKVAKIIGKITFWDHQPDAIISTNPDTGKKVIEMTKPYVIIGLES